MLGIHLQNPNGHLAPRPRSETVKADYKECCELLISPTPVITVSVVPPFKLRQLHKMMVSNKPHLHFISKPQMEVSASLKGNGFQKPS